LVVDAAWSRGALAAKSQDGDGAALRSPVPIVMRDDRQLIDANPATAENMRMKHLLIVLAAVIAFAAQTHAAARIDQLRAQRGAPGMCTSDRIWCIVRTGDDAVTVLHNGTSRYREVAHLALPQNEDDRVESGLWPSIVRIALPGQSEVALVGVERTQREMYSGGGASVVRLTLFEMREGAQPRAVLEAPLSGSVMTRACFTREDERARRGACHDEYRYSATLTAPPQRPNDARLIYRSRADTFPGPRSRTRDSLRDAPLRKADLRRVPDRNCTVERTLTRSPAKGTFTWNAPLPPCADYLELQ
jgi:hypothetical protein